MDRSGPLDVRGFRAASPPRRPGRRQAARVQPYSREGENGQRGGAMGSRWDDVGSSAGPMSSWSQGSSLSASSSSSGSRFGASASRSPGSPQPGPSHASEPQLPPPSYPIDFNVRII